jgi:hypothetical protein
MQVSRFEAHATRQGRPRRWPELRSPSTSLETSQLAPWWRQFGAHSISEIGRRLLEELLDQLPHCFMLANIAERVSFRVSMTSVQTDPGVLVALPSATSTERPSTRGLPEAGTSAANPTTRTRTATSTPGRISRA